MSNHHARWGVSWLAAVCVLAGFLGAASPASGQGFMVKPMKMEFAPRAGQTIETTLELRNTSADEARTLDLKLLELTQGRNGGWRVIEPGSNVDTSALASCLKWTALSQSAVTVKPLETAAVTVTLKVPRAARGFYATALIAQTRPKPGPRTGVAIVIRFLIPILVEIQGRPVRQKIGLSDVGMVFRGASENAPPTTFVTLGATNQGLTYSRIKGRVKVMFFSNGRWRPVSTADIKETGIIPGVKLSLGADLKRRLPSGRYKLTASLYVDGRRVKPLKKEIDFEGDPTVTKLAVDTSLMLDPPELSIAGAPGAMRTAVLKVENASEDAVNIEAASLVPPSLRGVAMGELKGEELSCAPWIKVSPAKFTLRASGKQNIRVIAKMPKAEKMYAAYYGLLTLKATYPDGQSAGETTSLVCVTNAKVETKPAAQVMKLALAAEEGSKYVVQAKFGNTGNVHFMPKCSGMLLSGAGQMVQAVALSGEEGLMLPLEMRNFSGVIDFEKVEPGTYLVKTVIECGSGQAAAEQIPIRVTVEEGKKVITIIKQEAATSTAPETQAAGGGK